VKEGNWVEDKIGGTLAVSRAPVRQTNNSEHRRNFLDPREIAQTQQLTEQPKNRSKGLDAELLFNHGPQMFETDKVSLTIQNTRFNSASSTRFTFAHFHCILLVLNVLILH
jgi:hypothetical protein